MEEIPNKSQHTKLALERKILPPLLPGFELAIFRSRVRRSYQQAIPAGCFSVSIIHRTLTWTTGSFTRVHLLAMRAFAHVRESVLKVNWEKNPLAHRGIEPAPAACRSDGLQTYLKPHPSPPPHNPRLRGKKKPSSGHARVRRCDTMVGTLE